LVPKSRWGPGASLRRRQLHQGGRHPRRDLPLPARSRRLRRGQL